MLHAVLAGRDDGRNVHARGNDSAKRTTNATSVRNWSKDLWSSWKMVIGAALVVLAFCGSVWGGRRNTAGNIMLLPVNSPTGTRTASIWHPSWDRLPLLGMSHKNQHQHQHHHHHHHHHGEEINSPALSCDTMLLGVFQESCLFSPPPGTSGRRYIPEGVWDGFWIAAPKTDGSMGFLSLEFSENSPYFGGLPLLELGRSDQTGHIVPTPLANCRLSDFRAITKVGKSDWSEETTYSSLSFNAPCPKGEYLLASLPDVGGSCALIKVHGKECQQILSTAKKIFRKHSFRGSSNVTSIDWLRNQELCA